jgi:hypothetical protein
LYIGITVAFFHSPGVEALLIVMSNNRARYGIIGSQPSFRISAGIPTGPVDLFLLTAADCFLTMLMLMV